MAIPKADRQLEQQASQLLAPGEHVVAAARALAVGAFEGRLGIFGEVVTGALMQSLLTGESVRRAHRAQFPAAPRMVIGMTDRRLLVWKAGLMSHRPVRLLGEISLERLASVSVQPAVDRRLVTFAFVDAPPVSVTAYKRDHPERFAENFLRHYEAPPMSAAVAAETAPETLAPADLPGSPAVPAGLTVPSMPAVSAATASSVATATPPLPPPPPVARPARPAALSWATALPQTAAASSSQGLASDQRKCIQCGTPNPAGAAFCWRCYVPFAEPSIPTRPPTPKPVAPSPLIAGAMDTGVRNSLSWGAAPAPIKTRYRSGAVWKVAIAVAVALVGVVAYGGAREAWARYSRTHVTVPDTIAGMNRIDDPRLQPYVDQLENVARQNDMVGKAAYYGFSGAPRFYFAAFEHRRGADETPDSIFADFARGYASTGHASIDLETKTTDASEEATFICARVKGKVRGSICMWNDRDTVGFVQTSRQGVQITHDLTAVVRFSVEA